MAPISSSALPPPILTDGVPGHVVTNTMPPAAPAVGYQPATSDANNNLVRAPSQLSRVSSRPPVVCPFGSVAPDYDEEGDSHAFRPVRSREEAMARDERRNRARGLSTAGKAGVPAPIRERSQSRVRGGDSPNESTSEGTVAEDEMLERQMMAGDKLIRGGDADAEKNAQTAVNSTSSADGKDDDELWMVRFDPGDKANPKNWSVLYRWYLTAAGSLLVLNSTFSSSAPSGIVGDLERQFGFAQEVGVLTISLFVAGYCVGPLLWGPLSESFGRRPIFLVTFLFYTGFQVGCALAPNTAAILIFRLLSGIFAACPLTNAGALLADVWDPDRRGIAMAFFSLAPFAGPALGPIAGGFVSVGGIGWRWLFWILCIFAGVCGLVVFFTIPETYAPILLVQKAKKMRKETGEERWWAPLEKAEKSFGDVARDVLYKPFKILALEPMLIAITVYMSFVYGCIYLLFESLPIVFIEGHGFNAGEDGLVFLSVFIGGALACALYVLYYNPRYVKKAHAYRPEPTPPEARLAMALPAAPLFAVGFMIFAWTSYPNLPWIAPAIGTGVLGFSVLAIFVTLFNYIVDTYLWAAASALAANTVCRSLFGAVFPLFATQMYQALTPRWASFLLGCIAIIMAPIPFLLIKFGPTLRAKSKFSPAKR